MVFEAEGQFQQFLHCKFKENVVRLLYIPTLEDGNVFLVVNKYGKVGLYEPNRLRLIHTYCLDLSVPMHPQQSLFKTKLIKAPEIPSKCQRTHLIVDAVYASDIQTLIFATTKSILQCYDIGEIESQSLGLEILPRKEFMNLRDGKSPCSLKNKGHVETHRILGLDTVPSCLKYCSSDDTQLIKEHNVEVSVKSAAKLLIGDSDGGVTIVLIDNKKFPFLGQRKIRGFLHKIRLEELRAEGKVKSYKAHNDLVKQIDFLSHRQLIISCSRDRKFSLFCEDYSDISEPFIISLPNGVNSVTYSNTLNIIGAGSEDGVVRIFSQFSMKMPQMELTGHRSPVVAVNVLSVPFSDNPILLSFSEDVEIRAWDPVTFVCLQSLYLRFPISSTISCKTPEFSKCPLVIHQPHYYKTISLNNPLKLNNQSLDSSPTPNKLSNNSETNPQNNNEGFIILLYCNSYAKLKIEKDSSNCWPFDYEDFLSDFEQLSIKTDQVKRIRQKVQNQSKSKNPKLVKLTPEEISEVELKAKTIQQSLMKLKNNIDNQLGSRIYNPSQPTLAYNATKRLCALDTKTSYMDRILQRNASMFNKIPFYEIQDPQAPSPLSSTSLQSESINPQKQ